MGMGGLLAQMGLGAAANVGQGIGDRIRKDAALAREKALNDQRFGQSQELEATRFSNNEAIADKNHGYRLDEQTNDDKLARGRAKDDRAYNEKMGFNKSGKLDPLLEKRVDDLAKQREQWINRLENESLSPEDAQEIKDGINGINSSIERLLYPDSKPTSRLNPEALNAMLTKIKGLSPEEQQQGLEEIRAKHGDEIAAQIQKQIGDGSNNTIPPEKTEILNTEEQGKGILSEQTLEQRINMASETRAVNKTEENRRNFAANNSKKLDSKLFELRTLANKAANQTAVNRLSNGERDRIAALVQELEGELQSRHWINESSKKEIQSLIASLKG